MAGAGVLREDTPTGERYRALMHALKGRLSRSYTVGDKLLSVDMRRINRLWLRGMREADRKRNA